MKCPTCGAPVELKDNPARPFCSERCKLIDFGRWADEEFRIPVAETPLEEAEEDPLMPAVTNDSERQR